MKNRKQFAHRIDMWDDDGENIVEHLAAVGDFDLAVATYRAACLRWPNAAITLRQGTRVNGNYRRGDWTTKAIEERRWLRSLVQAFGKTGTHR
jgi:hypothetical protein